MDHLKTLLEEIRRLADEAAENWELNMEFEDECGTRKWAAVGSTLCGLLEWAKKQGMPIPPRRSWMEEFSTQRTVGA